jgi:hypothetical protein
VDLLVHAALYTIRQTAIDIAGIGTSSQRELPNCPKEIDSQT